MNRRPAGFFWYGNGSVSSFFLTSLRIFGTRVECAEVEISLLRQLLVFTPFGKRCSQPSCRFLRCGALSMRGDFTQAIQLLDRQHLVDIEQQGKLSAQLCHAQEIVHPDSGPEVWCRPDVLLG